MLRDLLEREKAGQDRKQRIPIEVESNPSRGPKKPRTGGNEVDDRPPEERHPDLDHPTRDKRHVRSLHGGTYRDMWVYCETQAGELVDVSKEMLGKARELMDAYNAAYDEDERVVAVLIGAAAIEHVEDVIAYGADSSSPRGRQTRTLPAQAVHRDILRHGPRGSHPPPRSRGDRVARLRQAAVRAVPGDEQRPGPLGARAGRTRLRPRQRLLGALHPEEVISNPVKTGVAGEKKEFQRVLHMKRPDFSGFEYSTILCIDNPTREFHPQGASVIPGSFDLPDPDSERDGDVVDYGTDIDDDWFTVEVEEYDRLSGGVDLSGHDVIVAVGRGIGDDPTRGIEQALDLVDAFDDADLGCPADHHLINLSTATSSSTTPRSDRSASPGRSSTRRLHRRGYLRRGPAQGRLDESDTSSPSTPTPTPHPRLLGLSHRGRPIRGLAAPDGGGRNR